MLYTVYCENKSDASAAAQDIYIVNPLSEWLDWTTFEMLDIGFNNQIDRGLDGQSSGVSEVSLKDTPYFVQSSVSLDETSGHVNVELHIIDKTTKYGVPEDPYAGILPPNDATHRGEGHISYRIKVREDAPSNVVITNSASIVFDYNDPIETDPAWWNTVGTFHGIELEIDGVATNLTLIAGEPFGELPAPKSSRTGYTFDGWYTGSNGTGLKATPTAIVPAGDFALYPNWIGVPYKVRFNANGGTGTMADQTFAYGTAQKLAVNTFTRKMYAFAGWARTADGDVAYADEQPVQNLATAANGVVTLYAVWEKTLNLLWSSGAEDAVPTTAACVYDGYLYDAGSGAVMGTIQVKVGKPNKKTGLAAVSATVVGLDGRKKKLKAADKGKAEIRPDGPTTILLVGGDACAVTLGADGLSGTYGAYAIDGARNFFSSKDKAELAAANAVLAPWLGAVNILWDGGSASVTMAKKGKAKATVLLANGTKATVSTQLLVGEDWLCVPVVATKKMSLAFTLWLPTGGGAAVVEGLSDDLVVGRPSALKSDAKFWIDAEEFSARWGQRALPYLPDGVSVVQNGTRWTVADGAKAGKVVYKRGTTEVDESKLGGNPSALKLTYKAKDGSFKGTFKVYADVKGRLKATTVNVTGLVIDGRGVGTATVKKVVSVPVTIE